MVLWYVHYCNLVLTIPNWCQLLRIEWTRSSRSGGILCPSCTMLYNVTHISRSSWWLGIHHNPSYLPNFPPICLVWVFQSLFLVQLYPHSNSSCWSEFPFSSLEHLRSPPNIPTHFTSIILIHSPEPPIGTQKCVPFFSARFQKMCPFKGLKKKVSEVPWLSIVINLILSPKAR